MFTLVCSSNMKTVYLRREDEEVIAYVFYDPVEATRFIRGRDNPSHWGLCQIADLEDFLRRLHWNGATRVHEVHADGRHSESHIEYLVCLLSIVDA